MEENITLFIYYCFIFR